MSVHSIRIIPAPWGGYRPDCYCGWIWEGWTSVWDGPSAPASVPAAMALGDEHVRSASWPARRPGPTNRPS